MDVEWLSCVNVSSSMITNVPLWWAMLIMGEAMASSGAYRKSLLSSHFYCEPKTAQETKVPKQKSPFSLGIQLPGAKFSESWELPHPKR